MGKKRKLFNITFKTSSFIKNNLIKTSITRDQKKKKKKNPNGVFEPWASEGFQILRQMLYRLSYHVFTSLSKLCEFVIYTILRCDRTILNPSTIDVMVDSPSKRQKPARYKFPSSENLFLVRVVIYNKIGRI